MLTPVIFPDGEIMLVQSIKNVLAEYGETGIKVSTRKNTPQQGKILKQITVRSDGGSISNRVMKEEDFGINIFVNNPDRVAGYAEASRLALLLEALLPILPQKFGSDLKQLSIENNIPIEVDAEEQQRYLTVTATVKGKNLTKN